MKKVLIIGLVVVLAILVFIVLVQKEVIKLPQFATMEDETETEEIVTSVDDLKAGCFYVWHNPESNSIQKDLIGATRKDVFKECPSGVKNWEDTDFVAHSLWFSTDEDADIPTLYPGDVLIYINPNKVPYDGIHWEHFADYGYSIGVANLIKDDSGHYYIKCDADKGYAGYINPKSDVAVLNDYIMVSELFLDGIGSVKVRENLVTDGGTVFGLERNKQYLCEWYTGTNFQDYYMTANNHVFGTIETFTTYDYEFLHSNCISITIPEWLKTGCYYLEDVGFFRYVTGDDVNKYTGAAYDPDINWNDPIIIRDENGFLEYDPTQKEADPDAAPKKDTEATDPEDEPLFYHGEGDGYDPDGDDDVGAEGWETFDNTNEVIVDGYSMQQSQSDTGAVDEPVTYNNNQEIDEPYFDN